MHKLAPAVKLSMVCLEVIRGSLFAAMQEDVARCKSHILMAFMTRIPRGQLHGRAKPRPREWYVGRYRLIDEPPEDSDEGGEPMESAEAINEIPGPEKDEEEAPQPP